MQGAASSKSPKSGFKVQLGSIKSGTRGAAAKEAARLMRTLKRVLGTRLVTPVRADLGEKGIFLPPAGRPDGQPILGRGAVRATVGAQPGLPHCRTVAACWAVLLRFKGTTQVRKCHPCCGSGGSEPMTGPGVNSAINGRGRCWRSMTQPQRGGTRRATACRGRKNEAT